MIVDHHWPATGGRGAFGRKAADPYIRTCSLGAADGEVLGVTDRDRIACARDELSTTSSGSSDWLQVYRCLMDDVFIVKGDTMLVSLYIHSAKFCRFLLLRIEF